MVTHHSKGANPLSKIYQKELCYQLEIWHLDFTQKMKTRWTTMDAYSLSQGWSPTVQNLPNGSVPQTWKELIRVFCCPTVNILSLQERQAGAFWCHEFLWPMEWRNNVKKSNIGLFSWMLDRLLQKMYFQYNEWMKPTETKHLGYLFPYRVKYCTISLLTVLVLHGLSRSHRQYKQISAESKLPLPNT